jgi:cell wall-associated NlpC family hydrolase
MPHRPGNTLQHVLQHRLSAAASAYTRLPRPLRLALPALALAVLVALGVAAGQAGARPAPAQSPSMTLAALRQPATQRPGYLVYLGAPPLSHTAPTSIVSARGGERPTAPPTASPTPTPAPLQPSTYTVAEGDTVAALAARFGISPETILWANGLADGQALEVGRQLTILPVSGVLYNVRRGDTLLAIAQAHRAEVDAIVEANALAAPDLLSIDQALIIPGGRPAPPPTPTPPPPPRGAPSQPEGEAAAVEGKGGEIIATAASFLGYPYVYGGSTPGTGFDCSGFSQYVYSQVGIGIPRGLSGQLGAGPAVQWGELLPGDLVFFQNTYIAGLSHVGIYVGDGRFIHACSPEVGVVYDSLNAAYWATRYYGASRPWQ